MNEPDTGSIVVPTRDYYLVSSREHKEPFVSPNHYGFKRVLESYPIGSVFIIIERREWMLTPTGRVVAYRSLRHRDRGGRAI